MLPDYLALNLDVIFVGTSVGMASAANRHYYSDPRNKFWQLLWEADLTGERLLIPEQDSQVLKYGIGLTDVVKTRVSSSDAALRTSDYDVPGFLAKIEKLKPFVVAFNGKKAAERVFHALGRGEPKLGLADWKIGESLIYVLPSSSGSNSRPSHFLPKASKSEWWTDFGAWLRSSFSRGGPTTRDFTQL